MLFLGNRKSTEAAVGCQLRCPAASKWGGAGLATTHSSRDERAWDFRPDMELQGLASL
jgi:hypothetical protein